MRTSGQESQPLTRSALSFLWHVLRKKLFCFYSFKFFDLFSFLNNKITCFGTWRPFYYRQANRKSQQVLAGGRWRRGKSCWSWLGGCQADLETGEGRTVCRKTVPGSSVKKSILKLLASNWKSQKWGKAKGSVFKLEIRKADILSNEDLQVMAWRIFIKTGAHYVAEWPWTHDLYLRLMSAYRWELARLAWWHHA